MSELKNWSQVASTNSDASPHGAPENMARSGVNDTMREGMAVLRRFLETPEWIDLLVENGEEFTVTKNTVLQVRVASGGTSSAVTKFPDGARIRIHESGGTYLYGFVNGTPTFSSPNTTVVVDIDGGTDVHANTDNIEIAIVRSGAGCIGRAAWSDTGTTLAQDPPQIPTIDDLGTAALLDNADATLDAGLLGGQTLAQVIASTSSGRNFLYNSSFKVWQRGTAIDNTGSKLNSDNLYCADRWRLLSGVAGTPTNDVVDLGRDTTDTPDLTWSCLRMTGATVAAGPSSERAGVLQVLPASDCQGLAVNGVSMAFDCKVTGTIGSVRCLLLKWTGTTEDDTAASPISSWSGAGTLPTLNADWTQIMDSGQLTATGSWVRYTPSGLQNQDLSVHGAAKNFAVLFYIDDASWATGSTCRMTNIQLELGTNSTTYQGVDHATELARCQRFYSKTFDEDTAPAQNTSLDGAVMSVSTEDGRVGLNWEYATTMRGTPTVTTYNPLAADSDLWDLNTSATKAWTPTTYNGTRATSWHDTGLNFSRVYAVHADADAEI